MLVVEQNLNTDPAVSDKRPERAHRHCVLHADGKSLATLQLKEDCRQHCRLICLPDAQNIVNTPAVD